MFAWVESVRLWQREAGAHKNRHNSQNLEVWGRRRGGRGPRDVTWTRVMHMKTRLRRGDLEDTVMEILWNDGGRMAPSAVQAELLPACRRAYTTVTTVLVRLWEKGRLDRTREGRAFVYHAIFTREDWVARRMSDVLGTGGDRTGTLVRFVAKLDDADRDQLRRMLGCERTVCADPASSDGQADVHHRTRRVKSNAILRTQA